MNKKIVGLFLVGLIIITGCTPALSSNQNLQQNIPINQTLECKDGICPIPTTDNSETIPTMVSETTVETPKPVEKFKITIFVRPDCLGCAKAEDYIGALIKDGYSDKWEVNIINLSEDKDGNIPKGDDPASIIAGRKNLLLFVQGCRKFNLETDMVPVIIVADKGGYRGFDINSPLNTIVPIEADMIECETP